MGTAWHGCAWLRSALLSVRGCPLLYNARLCLDRAPWGLMPYGRGTVRLGASCSLPNSCIVPPPFLASLLWAWFLLCAGRGREPLLLIVICPLGRPRPSLLLLAFRPSWRRWCPDVARCIV